MRISAEYLGDTSPVVPDGAGGGLREILHDYVVSLHEYSNGRGYPDDFSKKTDEAIDAILALHRAEIERTLEHLKRKSTKTDMVLRNGKWTPYYMTPVEEIDKCIDDIRQRAEGTK